MAEKVVLVCDVCAEQAVESVSMKVDGRSLVKDLCERHLAEMTAGARPARPGRRRAATTAPKKAATNRKRAARRKSTRGRKKATSRREESTG